MRRLAFVALLLPALAAAATVYQDRPVPIAAPCLVLFDGRWINASGIQDIAVGNYSAYKERSSSWYPTLESYTYRALRITMLNRQSFEITDAARFATVQADLLLQISRCTSPK